jgi:hypothetical protein
MDIFDTLTLIPVLRVQKPPTTYWLDNFMKQTITFDSEEIFFDVIVEYRRLAPFVSPNVQGRVMKETGFSTKTFRPAYVKPKHVLTPQRAIPRMAGEQIGGSMSMEQRLMALVAFNLQLEKEMTMRRWDWMACQAITTGFVTVAGDDYPTVTVDFGRDPSLDIVLTGAALWSAPTTANPLNDIDDARITAFNLSRQPINRLTFGLEAWYYFKQAPGVLQTLNDFFRGSASVFNTVTSEPGPYEYKGSLSGFNGSGQLDLWTYNDYYEDDNNNSVLYMPTNVVIGTGNGMEGFRAFGAIQDIQAGLVATDMYPKMWDKEDPSVRMMMTQSAPLMIPKQPNASFTLTVC